jgi:hypothetical protein
MSVLPLIGSNRLFALSVGMVPSPQAGAARAPSGRGAKPKRTWRQTQIHANFFQ